MIKSNVLRLTATGAVVLIGTAFHSEAQERSAQRELTSNEVAANGPLPGDVSLYQKELLCCRGLSTPGYYPSLNGAELADAERSAMYPCVSFTGSFEGPNQVYAWRSEDDYEE